MKGFVTALSILALLNLTVLEYGTAGEVQKKPLAIEEMVSLTEQQAKDFGAMQEVEAGLANGYGLLTLAFAIGVGFLIANELDDDDDDKSSGNKTGTTSQNTTTTTTTTTDSSTGKSTSSSSTTTSP